jgi:hypothetical protein
MALADAVELDAFAPRLSITRLGDDHIFSDWGTPDRDSCVPFES